MTMRIDRKTRFSIAACWFVVVTTAASPLTAAHSDDSQALSAANRESFAASSGDPRGMSEMLNTALAAGDADAVRTLLQEDVLVYESGGAEMSSAEYFEHHMAADAAFLSTLKRQHLSQAGGGDGVSAWVATRTRLTGRYNGKDVDLDSTETLVLNKAEKGWRIAHIHWSSAPHDASNS
jgi:ketosteroid isomerase-like protein